MQLIFNTVTVFYGTPSVQVQDFLGRAPVRNTLCSCLPGYISLAMNGAQDHGAFLHKAHCL